MTTRRNVQYSRLGVDADDYVDGGGRHDPRFDYSPGAFDRIPWKSIALALFLLLLGCGLPTLILRLYRPHGRRKISSIWPVWAWHPHLSTSAFNEGRLPWYFSRLLLWLLLHLVGVILGRGTTLTLIILQELL